MNRDAHGNCDQDERDRTVPDFGPQIEVRSEPLCDGLIEAQAAEQHQGPSHQIEHTEDKAAPPAVEQTQYDEQPEQDVDDVERHSRLRESGNRRTGIGN